MIVRVSPLGFGEGGKDSDDILDVRRVGRKALVDSGGKSVLHCVVLIYLDLKSCRLPAKAKLQLDFVPLRVGCYFPDG